MEDSNSRDLGAPAHHSMSYRPEIKMSLATARINKNYWPSDVTSKVWKDDMTGETYANCISSVKKRYPIYASTWMYGSLSVDMVETLQGILSCYPIPSIHLNRSGAVQCIVAFDADGQGYIWIK